MRFGYALLGLVTLTSIHTSSGQCSNGFPGVDRDDICCAASCLTCGGGGCGGRSGGPLNCCTSRIRDSGLVCSSTQPAPCIMESTSMCSNGIPGVQRDNYCCVASCGTCGGSGCATRPGGPDDCCAQKIRASGIMCDTSMASPCIISGSPVPSPEYAPTPAPTTAPPTTAPPTTAPPTTAPPTTAPPTTAPPTTAPPTTAPPTTAPPTTAPPTTAPPTPGPVCLNDIPGIQSGTACCDAQCGACGGTGCGGLPGGPANCCVGPIVSSGVMCSIAMMAPCIVDN